MEGPGLFLCLLPLPVCLPAETSHRGMSIFSRSCPQAQDPSSWVDAVPGVRPESRGGVYQGPPQPLCPWHGGSAAPALALGSVQLPAGSLLGPLLASAEGLRSPPYCREGPLKVFHPEVLGTSWPREAQTHGLAPKTRGSRRDLPKLNFGLSWLFFSRASLQELRDPRLGWGTMRHESQRCTR